MSRPCRRRWEVEAARDGRLEGRALAAFEEHVSVCRDCAEERRSLETAMKRLRTSAPVDEVALRRGRELLLESAHQVLDNSGAASRPWPRLVAVAAAALLGSLAVWATFGEPRVPDDAAVATVAASHGAKWERHRSDGKEQVDLSEGVLDFTVRHAAGVRFFVRVPDGEIDDEGTVFRVTVQNGRTTEIRVQEGAVVFRQPGKPVLRVVGGSTWVPAPASSATPVVNVEPPAEKAEAQAPKMAARKRLLRSDADRAQRPTAVPAPSASSALQEASPADEDLAYLAIVALRREGRTEEARVAAAEYLRKYPQGFRRVEVLAFLMR